MLTIRNPTLQSFWRGVAVRRTLVLQRAAATQLQAGTDRMY